MLFSGSEPADAISFTDETSRKNFSKTDRRVWTHAQVSKLASLDWFREYRSFYPEIIGELKSSKVLNDFGKMPRDVKMRISIGMRRVRIHIVDTYSYEAEYKQLLRGLYKCDNYEKMLREEENQEFVKFLIKDMEEHIAESILYDSPAQRLERSFEDRRLRGLGFYSLGSGYNFSKKLVVSLDPLRKGRKKVSDTASKWVSKSGSVFADAVDFAEKGFWGEYELRNYVGEMLNQSHAFDEGDDASIEWLEQQRNHFTSEAGFQRFRAKRLYGKVDSKLSERIQAADIASAIAQDIYDERDLQGVLDQFDYVTFNGQKINEDNMKKHLAHWNQVVEKENRIEKMISKL